MDNANNFSSPLVRLAAELEALDVLARFYGSSRKVALEIAREVFSNNYGEDVLAHLDKFVSRKRLVPADIASEAVVNYLQERVERIRKDDGSTVQATVLYSDFCEWFSSRNKDIQTPPSQKRFGQLMGKFEKVKRGGLYYYLGIRLKDQNPIGP